MAGNDVVIKQTSFNICMPETKDALIFLLKPRRYYNYCYLLATIPILQKHRKSERMSGCNYSFKAEKG